MDKKLFDIVKKAAGNFNLTHYEYMYLTTEGEKAGMNIEETHNELMRLVKLYKVMRVLVHNPLEE